MFDLLDEVAGIGSGWDPESLRGDEHIAAYRELTLARCRAEVDLALVVCSAERQQVYAEDGHATVAGWCRVQNRTSNTDIASVRRLGRLLHALPVLAAAARDGRIGLAQLHLLARAHSNPRCGHLLGDYVSIFIESATTMSYAHFTQVVERWELCNDPDGAHRDAEAAERERKAHLLDREHGFALHASGATIAGAQIKEILDRYYQAEWDTDWAETKALHGDAAHPALMPRTDAQRRFDALMKLFLDAASTPPGAEAPDPLVNILIDADTFEEAMIAMFGLDTGEQILGHDHRSRTERRCRDPRRRRCETLDGTIVDPYQVIVAAIIGQVRRVVYDTAGVAIDMGRKSRLFTGNARDAILLSTSRCLWPGCDLPSGRCQTDHTVEWSTGGPTDQSNGGPMCHRHNQWKNRGYTVWRDPNSNWHTYRPDGTEIR